MSGLEDYRDLVSPEAVVAAMTEACDCQTPCNRQVEVVRELVDAAWREGAVMGCERVDVKRAVWRR